MLIWLYINQKKNEIVSATAKGLNLKTEGLTMAQYDELLAKINALQPKIYNYIDKKYASMGAPICTKSGRRWIGEG